MLRVAPFRSGLRIAAATCAAAAASGCGMSPTIPGLPPYRIEVQQGNYVSQEMVAQLKPGMTREQVRFVLGTPLVTDIFHADRWDYVYFREPPGKPREQRRLSVFFENDRLARVSGDVTPAAPATDPAAAPAPAKPAAAAPATKPEPQAAPEPPRQNWSTASDQPEPKPAPPPPPAEESATKPAAQAAEERGFFGRMLDRLKGSE